MKPATIATKLVAKYGTRRAHLKAKARVMRGVGFRLHKGFWLTWMEVGKHVERIGNSTGWGDAPKVCTCTSGIHDGLCMKGCRASGLAV